MTGVDISWRGDFASGEVDALHSAAFGHDPTGEDWLGQVRRHSLGWVTAREGAELVGWVNVVWDGTGHAFLIDTIVRDDRGRRGIGTALVEAAVTGARGAGCEWMHVDFDPEHRDFYLEACGFEPAEAGLIEL